MEPNRRALARLVLACVVLVLACAVLSGCSSGGGSGTGFGFGGGGDQAVMAGVEAIAQGCADSYYATGYKPSAFALEPTIERYVNPWPTNPYTGGPMTNTEGGVGNYEVHSFPGTAGPSGSKADLVRGRLSNGEWYEVAVPY